MASRKYPKPSQYPKLTRVKDCWYRICFATKLKNNDMGFCDVDMKLIGISLNQSKEEMLATYFHEIKHAVSYEYSIPLNHPKIVRLEYDYRDIVMSFEWP